jgi:hypothetical protein
MMITLGRERDQQAETEERPDKREWCIAPGWQSQRIDVPPGEQRGISTIHTLLLLMRQDT